MYNYNLSHNEKLRFGGERRKGKKRERERERERDKYNYCC
jgi:hypothetical protein